MAKPKLRFPKFTDEWEEKQLKDFMFFKNGLNADKDKFGSGIKFISVMDILNNPFITYDVIRGKVDIDEKTLDNYSVTYGDVLFQRSSETREDAGKSNVYLDKENTATFGGFVIRGKKTGNYSPEFMNSLLKSPKVRKEITSKAQGAQHINVGQETLENVSIILPTIKEQERIAELLYSVDDVIQVQGEEISALEEQKKSIMQKLFNREVRFKANDGSEYPEWEEKRLNDILIEHMEKVKKPENTYIRLGIKSHGKGTFKEIVSDPSYIALEELFLCHEGDFIVNITFAWEHAVAILKKEDEGALVSFRFPMYRFKENCLSTFFKYWILRKRFKYLLGIASPGGAGRNRVLNKKELLEVEIKLPCLEEQQKIADCLLAYDETIQIKKDKLEVWKEIKKGLLQQMFV